LKLADGRIGDQAEALTHVANGLLGQAPTAGGLSSEAVKSKPPAESTSPFLFKPSLTPQQSDALSRFLARDLLNRLENPPATPATGWNLKPAGAANPAPAAPSLFDLMIQEQAKKAAAAKQPPK